MKIRLDYGSVKATEFVAKLPAECEVFEGEFVEKVERFTPPRNGFDAQVTLRTAAHHAH